MPYGDKYQIDDFIDEIESGCFNGSNGCGEFEDGTEIYCDIGWIQEHRKNHTHIIWYNK